jgi:hypothetical protein
MLYSINAGTACSTCYLSRIIRRLLIVGVATFALAACSKSSNNAVSAAEPKASPAQASSDPEPVAVDACALLSAEDARRVLGATVRSTPAAPGGCSYQQKPSGSERWESSVSLSVRQYRSASEENSAWGDLKLLRHLEAGRKNLTVLNGIGKEAYLENVPDRNAVDVSVIVHSEKSDFQLKEVTDHTPATDELKAIAQRIAGKVP